MPRSSALFAAIEDSNLYAESKQLLCACFAKLNATWSDGLTELFMTRAPEEIAHVLEFVARCCGLAPEQLNADYMEVAAALLQGSHCPRAVPIY